VDCQDSALGSDTRPLKETEPERIQTAGDSVIPVLDAIHHAAPHARIVLMGYPRLFVDDASCIDTLISKNEANWLNDMSHQLELALEESVHAVVQERDVPVAYVAPSGFYGHELCGTDVAFNAIVTDKTSGDSPGQLISSQSFHPNARGAGYFADTYSEELRKLGI
jgi:hypothetical protein